MCVALFREIMWMSSSWTMWSQEVCVFISNFRLMSVDDPMTSVPQFEAGT